MSVRALFLVFGSISFPALGQDDLRVRKEILRAKDFFVEIQDFDSVDKVWGAYFNYLSKKKQAKFEDFQVIEEFIEFFVSQKNRAKVWELVHRSWQMFQCEKSRMADVFCESLKKLWNDVLFDQMYFENSAVRLDRIKKQHAARECVPAKTALDLLAKDEGYFRSLLEAQLLLMSCLGDKEGEAATQKMLNERQLKMLPLTRKQDQRSLD